MIINTICRYFIWFVLYSFAGWLLETLLYILRDGKVVKRGFLFGPLCPIYGTAGLICGYLLRPLGKEITPLNLFLVFIAGFFLCGLLEYMTHFCMEKLFNAMWWDYSDRRFNIRGRVYLKGLVFFGIGALLIVYLIQPAFDRLTDRIPLTALYWLCFIIYTILMMDIATTVADLKGSIKALKHAQSVAMANTQEGVDRTSEQLEQLKENIKTSDLYMRTMRTLAEKSSAFGRIRRGYPDFKVKGKYRFLLDLVMDPPQEGKRSSDKKLYGTADSLPSDADVPDEQPPETDAQPKEE